MGKKKVKIVKATVGYFEDYRKKQNAAGCNIPADKVLLIRTGCELSVLTKDDIAYMSSPDTSYIGAENRLRSRRLE